MKANELMVGDLIKTNSHSWNDETLENKYCKVKMVGQNYLSCSLIDNPKRKLYVEGTFFEPIPLTPEILEKNGFKVTRNISSSGNKDVWSLYVSKYKIFYITEHHNKKMFPYFWIEIGSNSDIKYIHQLQHALRLCGIDKEIEL